MRRSIVTVALLVGALAPVPLVAACGKPCKGIVDKQQTDSSHTLKLTVDAKNDLDQPVQCSVTGTQEKLKYCTPGTEYPGCQL